MVSDFRMPPMGYGPGSQAPAEGDLELEYLPMPQDMRAYSPHIPDIVLVPELAPAMDILAQIAAAATVSGQGGPNKNFDLSGLDKENRALIAETLGQGEVSVKIAGIPAVAAQESVFAGVWSLAGAGVDKVEVGAVPKLSLERAFISREPILGAKTEPFPGVVNAMPLAVELIEKSEKWTVGAEPHVVNLTLLPHTEEDLLWLDKALGKGSVNFLSRGYGNCLVTATGQKNVWRVQFFNSMDTLILDTFEVTDVPEVVVAAPEDLIDSGARMIEVIEAIQ